MLRIGHGIDANAVADQSAAGAAAPEATEPGRTDHPAAAAVRGVDGQVHAAARTHREGRNAVLAHAPGTAPGRASQAARATMGGALIEGHALQVAAGLSRGAPARLPEIHLRPAGSDGEQREGRGDHRGAAT